MADLWGKADGYTYIRMEGTEVPGTNAMTTVFLLDVDNTLLDNDRVVADLRRHLLRVVGPEREARYWAIFEQHRAEVGYADYLGTLQRCRLEDPRDQHLRTIASFLLGYPFANCLYPGALEVLALLGARGRTVILSDGDVVFQPLKVERSGLFAAVDGRVLIYVHKEQELDDVERLYPADHYVFVDDKIRLLTAFKRTWGDRVTTVFPRQGHYAHDPEVVAWPAPDITIERIGALLAADLLPGGAAPPRRHS
ncbi:MAG TPA: HAD family hydrolase [Gemmatimonadales bacterium]|nr:HAD family hydrolase [Gemmatimonadales bacterium]